MHVNQLETKQKIEESKKRKKNKKNCNPSLSMLVQFKKRAMGKFILSE